MCSQNEKKIEKIFERQLVILIATLIMINIMAFIQIIFCDRLKTDTLIIYKILSKKDFILSTIYRNIF